MLKAEDRCDGLTLLAEAGTLLAASLDNSATLSSVAQLLVPRLADWCAIYVHEDEAGGLYRAWLAHVDPARHELLQGMHQRFERGIHDACPVTAVMHSGQPILANQISDEDLRAGSQSDEQYHFLRDVIGVTSAMIVPMQCRGRALGTLCLHLSDPRRSYDAQDLALAQELARLSALALDNARRYREAQEAIRAREDFLSIASHELRAPLSVLDMQVQVALAALAQSNGTGLSKDQQAQALKCLERQVRRMSGLVNALFDVARLRAGREEPRCERVDLSQVVREVAERFEAELLQAGSALSLRVEAPGIGLWDRTRVEQVVTNLLANAVKYGDGQPIEIAVESREHTVLLTVSDQGVGIPQELRTRIFERFERGAMGHRHPGLGLGLYIVRSILETLGGTIRVLSQPGAGSAFVVELPREPPPRAGGAAAQPTPAHQRPPQEERAGVSVTPPTRRRHAGTQR